MLVHVMMRWARYNAPSQVVPQEYFRSCPDNDMEGQGLFYCHQVKNIHEATGRCAMSFNREIYKTEVRVWQ